MSALTSKLRRMTTPRLPHGRTLLHRVLETGLRRHLEQLGFTRRTYEFHRARGVLSEVITLSVRTERHPPGQRVFWLIASLETEPGPRFTVHHDCWRLELSFDAADFAVGLTEDVHRHALPALERNGVDETARHFEQWRQWQEAVTLWRAAGRPEEAARAEADQRRWEQDAPF